MSTVMLALNGEQILMDNMMVIPSLQFEESDKSGQTSSTSTSEKGVKAKELRVTGLIPYKRAKQLTRLFALAEATGSDNGRQRYRVANITAQAVNFREGIFAGRIDATEQQKLMAWRVQFTLREQRSVSEKKQERITTPKSSQQTAKGTTADKAKQGEQKNGEATWFENLSKKVNDMIGPPATAEDTANETDKKA